MKKYTSKTTDHPFMTCSCPNCKNIREKQFNMPEEQVIAKLLNENKNCQ